MPGLIKIGNSQGIRIPKAIIEQADLENRELVFKIVDKGLLIQPVDMPRKGWKEAFDKDSKEIDQFDREWLEASLVSDEEWEW